EREERVRLGRAGLGNVEAQAARLDVAMLDALDGGERAGHRRAAYPSGMDRTDLSRWVESYEGAWRTAGTEMLAELFTADATYAMAPFEESHRGLAAIGEMWEAERQGPNEVFTMQRDRRGRGRHRSRARGGRLRG